MTTPHYVHERKVWLLDLEPTRGVELQKIRPCLALRKFSQKHFVVLPLTSKSRSEVISFKLENISFLASKNNWVNTSQIRIVDISRFQRRLGKISPFLFFKTGKKTAEVLRLSPQEPSDHNVSWLYSF